MPYFETKILGFKHDEPYLTKCKGRSCYFDECRELEYSCIGIRSIEHEIVIGFSYPNVADNDEYNILLCADDATYVASGIVIAVVKSCVEFDMSCIFPINRSIILADRRGREVFLEGLRQSGLLKETINACKVKVFIR